MHSALLFSVCSSLGAVRVFFLLFLRIFGVGVGVGDGAACKYFIFLSSWFSLTFYPFILLFFS